jgi:hypothetical protein
MVSLIGREIQILREEKIVRHPALNRAPGRKTNSWGRFDVSLLPKITPLRFAPTIVMAAVFPLFPIVFLAENFSISYSKSDKRR